MLWPERKKIHFLNLRECMNFQLNKISFSIVIAYNLIASQTSFASTLTPTQTDLSFDYSLNGLGISKTGTGSVNESAGFPDQYSNWGLLPGVRVLNNGTDIAVAAYAGGDTSGYDYFGDAKPIIPFSDAKASSTFHAVYTNNGAFADRFNFSFNISRGNVFLYDTTHPGFATFSGQVLINDVIAWSSSANINNNSHPLSFSTSGVDLGWKNDRYFSQYEFFNYNGTVNLGTLNPNESVDVKYILTTTASSRGDGNYGGAIAEVNDPFGASSENGIPSISVSSASPVPLPNSLAMMAGGLGLLASRIRTRKPR